MLSNGLLSLSESSFITSCIINGISLPFVLPDSLPPAVHYKNTPLVDSNIEMVRERLQDYIKIGAVEQLPVKFNLSAVTIQPLHVVLKNGRKPRLVIDLSRNLNPHLQQTKFSYSRVEDAVKLSHPGCWYAKLDLSNCFLSFPLHPSVWDHFIFCIDNVYYRFIRMPFGLSCAPQICTLLLSVVAFALTKNKCKFVRYLDDFLFIASSRQDCLRQLSTAIHIFQQFGLVVNPDKTEGPTQTIIFLGIKICSLTQTLSCTEERINELLSLLHSFLNSPSKSDPNTTNHSYFIRRRNLESLIGKLSFAAQVLPGARPFLRRMLDCLHSSPNHKSKIRLSAAFYQDVQYWIQHLSSWNGKAKWRDSEPVIIATDASLDGFGFYLESLPPHISVTSLPPHLRPGHGFIGVYSPSHSSYHHSSRDMVWCELFAVLAAAHTFASHPIFHNQSFLFRVDNQPDVQIINRQSTKSSRLSLLLRSLSHYSHQYNICISAQHRPGSLNILADFLSRPQHHHFSPLTHWSSFSNSLLSSSLHSSSVSLPVFISFSMIYSAEIPTLEILPPSPT